MGQFDESIHIGEAKPGVQLSNAILEARAILNVIAYTFWVEDVTFFFNDKIITVAKDGTYVVRKKD